MVDESLQAILMVQWDASTRMETDHLRLLEAIRNQGSISAAARTVDLTCKAAWDAVNAMNNLFDQRLLAASPGGAGGDARVAPAGHQVVDAFIILQARQDHRGADYQKEHRLSRP